MATIAACFAKGQSGLCLHRCLHCATKRPAVNKSVRWAIKWNWNCQWKLPMCAVTTDKICICTDILHLIFLSRNRNTEAPVALCHRLLFLLPFWTSFSKPEVHNKTKGAILPFRSQAIRSWSGLGKIFMGLGWNPEKYVLIAVGCPYWQDMTVAGQPSSWPWS